MEDSHQTFSDVASLLACVGSECVFCDKKELANKDHLKKKHLRDAVYFYENGQEKFVVACFCNEKLQSSRSHYHCPLCQYDTFTRSSNFIKHLKGRHGIASEKRQEKPGVLKRKAEDVIDVSQKQAKPEVLKEKTDDAIDVTAKSLDSKTSIFKKIPDDVTRDPIEKQDTKATSFVCPHCTAVLSSAKNVRRHIRELHNIDATPMICVDAMSGIYVTPKHNHSPVLPIHVI
ncbi:uncharacterized protein [Pseudorasbora parva]|uniref:uncharacterized protein n=1 Tax=Pseudorasbora parva TaxID=51549 RepID=UPI00351EAB30